MDLTTLDYSISYKCNHKHDLLWSYVFFYDLSLYLGMTFSAVVEHVSVTHSLLLLSNIPLYRYTTICLHITKLTDIWVCLKKLSHRSQRVQKWYPLFLAIMNDAAARIWVQVFVWTYVFISFRYLGVELPGHMVTLCLTFWGAIFPKWVVSNSQPDCFPSSFSIYPHQQDMRVPTSPQTNIWHYTLGWAWNVLWS